ncbi:MAG: ubiquinone biosynthesis regulatory protein kinase UbiB, partial [Alteromonadales bacterium]|nr:ubiquinone biosynthesis regulatory protein kinase UbiB [Alteromonadales bacterium]
MSSQRLYQIVKTFLNFGLDKMVPAGLLPWYAKLGRTSLFWLRNRHKDKTPEQRFRLAIEGLGPVFIKFGQMLSTRRDLLPPELADELALLQDKVTPFSGDEALELIIDAMGKDVFEHNFTEFDLTPLASASIAQVHTATLLVDGKEKKVVIKVLRPNISETILADIKVMSLFAGIVARWLPDGKRLRPKEVVEEYRKTILDELDLNREAANAIQLKRNFEQGSDYDKALYVPEIFSECSFKNILVMERIYGIGVGEIDVLNQLGVDMKLLAERGVEVFFTQVFRD